jgi:putative sterol carrier protein
MKLKASPSDKNPTKQNIFSHPAKQPASSPTSRGGKSVQVKTPKEFFEQTLPAKFDPKKAEGLEATIQMNITGPNGGDWTITVANQQMKIREGIETSPTISVTMSDTDFVDLVNGKLGAFKAFMTGKIQFKGSISVGMRLMDLGFT